MQEEMYLVLLSKRASGELTPAESEALQVWLQETPDHARTAEEIQRTWDAVGNWQPVVSVDMDAAFARLQRTLGQDAQPVETAPLQVTHRRRFAWVRVAAAVLFLLLSIWGYQHWQSTRLGAVENMALWMTERVEAGDKKIITLADGTRIWLRKGSVLRHPRNFEGKNRPVSLEGEAYFEVAHNPQQPFQVAMPNGGHVEVLGTAFNIKATSNSTKASVLVREGRVRYQQAQQTVILTARKKAEFDGSTASLTQSEVVSFNELAWQTGRMEFNATALQQVIRDIEHNFGVLVTLGNAEMADCPFTMSSNQPLEQLLNALAQSGGMTVRKVDATHYTLEGGSCPN